MADTEAPAHPDPAFVPAKAAGTTSGENEPIKPDQTRGLSRLPSDVKASISKTDELLLRLNKLIKTTAGLGAGLSTLNYSLYLLAYLHANSPSRAAVIAYISRLVGRTPSKLPQGVLGAAPVVSPLGTIGALVSDTRTTLRLTGLLPLYVWLKTLVSQNGSKSVDPVLHRVALVQCLAYMAFQSIENVYHLTGKAIIAPTFVGTRGGVPSWVRWSCRAWLVGVTSDFLRLWREAVLAQEKRDKGEKVSAKEQEAIDRKWWGEFQTAAAWMPVAIHYSLDGGLKGMNTGLVGLFGLLAGLNNFRNAWAATAN